MRRIVAGTWTAQRAGDSMTLSDGQVRRWEAAMSADDGWLTHAALRGGYALAVVECDKPGILLLEAFGHGMVYVNGEPRGGDPYAYGWARLPIEAIKEANTLLFQYGHGRVCARLTEAKPGRQFAFNPRDVTLPDLLAGGSVYVWGSIPVTCVADRFANDWSLDGGDFVVAGE